MKWRIFLLALGFLLLSVCPIPKYVELNHLTLIHSMEVYCMDEQYKIILEEIIPKKENNGIEYEYKQYQNRGTDLLNIKRELEAKEKNPFYYNSIKKITTNCKDIKKVLDIFSLTSRNVKIKTDTNHFYS